MGVWVRKWEIAITWDSAQRSPLGTTYYTAHVDSPEELRELVEYARADPNVTSLPHRIVRMVEGDAPSHCGNGHPHHEIQPGTRITSRTRDVDCSCGGHYIQVCHRCGDETADPPRGDGCDPSQRADPDGLYPPSTRIESPSPPTLLARLRRQAGQPPTGSHSYCGEDASKSSTRRHS